MYNVHSLVHISAEVEHFGKQDNSSAFIFENFMQKLKHCVRSAGNLVVHVGRRLTKHRLHSVRKEAVVNVSYSLDSYGYGTPDNCCILENGRCCQIINIVGEHAACIMFSNAEPPLVIPYDSRVLGIHKVQLSKGVVKTLPAKTQAFKCLFFPDYERNHLVFVKLLHAA